MFTSLQNFATFWWARSRLYRVSLSPAPLMLRKGAEREVAIREMKARAEMATIKIVQDSKTMPRIARRPPQPLGCFLSTGVLFSSLGYSDFRRRSM